MAPMASRQVFCRKCHQVAATIKTKDGKVKVMQGGKSMITLSEGSGSNISVRCPNGHNVRLEL